jgi:hypothetical protein
MLLAMHQLVGLYNNIAYLMAYTLCLIAGIFAFLNFLSPYSREEIIRILVNGLKRLEYRGYDSAGMLCFC